MNDNQSPLQSMRERMEALMGKIVKMEQEQQAILDSVKSVVDDGQKVGSSVDNLSQRVHEVTGAYTTCMSQIKRQINALNEACNNCMNNLLIEGKNVNSGAALFVDEAKKNLAESEANSSYDKSGFRLSTTILPGDGTMLEVNTDIPQAENMPKRQVSFKDGQPEAPEQPAAVSEPEPKPAPADINDGLDALAAFIDPSLKTTSEPEPEAEAEVPAENTESESEPETEAEVPAEDTESESEPAAEAEVPAENTESESEPEAEPETAVENTESEAEPEAEAEAAAETTAESSEPAEPAEPAEEESVPHYHYWEPEKKEEAVFPASKPADSETKEEDKKEEEKPWYAQKEEDASLGRPQVRIVQQTVTPIEQTPKVSVNDSRRSHDVSRLTETAPADRPASQKVPKNRSFFARILGK